MNLITLTDTKLADLNRRVENEIERRTRTATGSYDAAAVIYSNEMAKRAVVVAAAGNHSLLLLGEPNCGKTMMRAAALELGLSQTFEVRPCPCGYRGTPYVSCNCTDGQIVRHVRKFPKADITVEMVRPSEREMMRTPGTTLVNMRRQIELKSDYGSLDLAEDVNTFLSHAVREIGLDPDIRRRAIAVARTIANLDGRERIEVVHLMEAINYRLRI